MHFDIVNIFDTIYEIRDGSGIGVFAPQYGMRRGYFVGVSKNYESRTFAPCTLSQAPSLFRYRSSGRHRYRCCTARTYQQH
jgi:hypothetical protein